MNGFVTYVHCIISQLNPAPVESVNQDFNEWRKHSNRSANFLEHCRQLLTDTEYLTQNDLVADSFLKNETYPTMKYPRVINAYPDKLKAIWGPLMHCAEKHFFSNTKYSKHFVKTIPVADRPALLEEAFGDSPVVVGDFSSFEGAHRHVYAKLVCLTITKMFSRCENAKSFGALLYTQMCTTNTMRFKGLGVSAEIEQTLMSGAPWTSFANAVLCFYLVSYLRLKTDHPELDGRALFGKMGSYVGYHEGDDSITRGKAYDPDLVARLGLRLKSQMFKNCNIASFCGIVKPSGENDIITDPKKVICNFFLLPASETNSKDSKVLALFRAKALSYMHQYQNCPMVGALAEAVLYKTKSIAPDPRLLSYHQSESFAQAGKGLSHKISNPSPKARDLVEELFGFSTSEQVRFEESIRRWARENTEVYFPDQFEPYFDECARGVARGKFEVRWRGALRDPDELTARGWLNAEKWQQGLTAKHKKTQFKTVKNPAADVFTR